MKMRVRKGCANVIANVIRQVALTQIASVKLIGIKIGANSNVIDSGNNVLEDMIQICSKLNKLTYVTKGTKQIGDIFKTTILVTDVLKASDIETSEFSVIAEDSDREVMHVLDGSVKVTIYFRLGVNVSTKNENVFYLDRAGFSTDGLVVVNSRHTDITNFAYTISEIDSETDEIEFQVETNVANTYGSENHVITMSKQLIIEILQEF